MRFNNTGDISTLNGSSLKLVDKFTYLGSSFSSTETNIDRLLAKACIAINILSVIWKSDLTEKIKRSFFRSRSRVVTAIWVHYMDANWTYGEKAWQQLHKNAASNIEQVMETAPHKAAAVRPPTTYHKIINIRRTRHVEHCRRRRDELISDVLQGTASHGRA